MGEAVNSNGVSLADLATAVLSQLAAQNLGDVGTYTLATLPDPSLWPKRTIWVSDLWSATTQPGDRMVSAGGQWKAIRPFATASVNSATMTVAPLTATTFLLQNGPGIGVTHNVTLGSGSGYAVPTVGSRIRLVKPTIAFLGTINILGLTTSALTGWFDYDWNGSAWQESASGGIL